MSDRSTTLSPGHRLGPYEILSLHGAGGMGEVYQARDTRLNRIVAIKVLPEALLEDPERRRRLEVEARAVSSLAHPNICTLHDIGHEDTPRGPVDYLVMEYLEGETLAKRLGGERLPLDQCLRHAMEIASALDMAHRRGIVHRDLKPENVMLTSTGAKLMDFGLARRLRVLPQGEDGSAMPTVTRGGETRTGTILGTPSYMSPEQALGRSADARSDIFAFGLLLHEMVAGQRAFPGKEPLQVLASILRDEPPPARGIRPEIGEDLQKIIDRCLRKDPAERFPDAAALLSDLRAGEARRAKGAGRRPWRSSLLVPVAAVALVAVVLSAWIGWRGYRDRRARRTILPEITRLWENDQPMAAFHLARESRDQLAGDPEFDDLWHGLSSPTSLDTQPEGAEVLYKSYEDPNAVWERLGVTPVENVRVPFGQLRWKIEKEGFEPIELAFPGLILPSPTRLIPLPQAPPGMVHVPGGKAGYRAIRNVELGDYWLDRYEVSNRDFKKFVDQGGYRNRTYWPETFAKAGRTLSFEEAMGLFRDSTGRPGPSTWELGSYPEGEADLPVAGVSWYEARAYAKFAGKRLPTLLHWFHAAGADDYFSGIIRLSNFGGQGPAPVGGHQGMSPWGNYDMAGNVREWVWNAAGDRRYTLGGSWSDPSYMFNDPDALDPFDRDPMLGFRCALYPTPPPDEAFGPIEVVFRDYTKETPVADEIFEAYRRLHRYDPLPLDARVESSDEAPEYWKEERVSYAAAYNGERIPATLFIPKNASPPYQVVLYFPPGNSRFLNSIHDAGTRQFGFLIRSGRALLFPSYKGTYERRLPPEMAGPNAQRDIRIAWSKDVGRSLDYLESRSDIDARRIAYYGVSMGAEYAPIADAVDSRFRAMILVSGGLGSDTLPPEIDPFNFAPHVHAPVLMINGSHDFIFPPHESQEPLFRLFGSPKGEKRHSVFDGGHIPAHWQEIARATLDWLDRWLGPVRQSPGP